MALQKEISVHGSGVVASYWRLSALNVDFDAQDARITLSGYVDKEHRDAGHRALVTRVIRWVGAENPITPARMIAGTAFTAAYAKLIAPETRPFMPPNPFSGATSV